MAINRKLPFGYQMRGGVVVSHPGEPQTVRMIFLQYAAGYSYAKLTQELNQGSVPYLPEKIWNKNMVARILTDERYLGTAQLPQVIDPQLYHAVRERLPSKAPTRKKSELADMIQRLAMCGVCGARAGREPYSHGKERWYCPECKAITNKITDQKLEAGVEQIMKMLIGSPQMVMQDPEHAEGTSISATVGESAFRELLDTPNFDEMLARQMALDLAADRFNTLGSEDYESRRIQHILQNTDDQKVSSPKLLLQIAEAVLIHPDGKVSLRLKSRQIIDGK